MRLPTGWLVDAAALRKGCVIVAGMALVLTGLRAVAAWGDAGKEDRLAGVFRPYETAPPPSGSPASGTRISAESWDWRVRCLRQAAARQSGILSGSA
jgi:hypothetical protein